jgi:hypothetical protein
MLAISAENLTRLRNGITMAIGTEGRFISFLRQSLGLCIARMALAMEYPMQKPSPFQNIAESLRYAVWLLNKLSKSSWMPFTWLAEDRNRNIQIWRRTGTARRDCR